MNCHLLAHFADQRREATDIGFIERCVDLVEQAERRRVQAENREYERHGRQRFFAAGQQRNRAHAFAGRPRHDRYAGREQIVTGQFQMRVPAAEQAREQLLHAGVDAAKVSLKRARVSLSILRIAPSSVSSAVLRSVSCASR